MGQVFLLSGASGVGKTTFLHALSDKFGPEEIRIIPRHTERPQRENEVDDFEYHFLPHRDFLEKVYANEFIHVERWGNFYTGIDRSYIEEALSTRGCSIILASIFGAARLRASYNFGLTHLCMWTGSRKTLMEPSCMNVNSPEVKELIFRIKKKMQERGFTIEETESLVKERFAEKRMVDNFVDIAAANSKLRNREEIIVLPNLRDKMSDVVNQFTIVLEEVGKSNNDVSENRGCFVLMPFSSEMTSVYEDHIVPVCEDVGIKALRADGIFSNKPIIDDIRESVASARVIVADLTDSNPNVFYEVGICHAIGKQVILLTQNPDIPFDLRHLRCIIYRYTPPGMRDFERSLAATLRAVLSL